MNIRFWVYLIVIGGYILFGLIGSWKDIWPWGAVMLVVPIIIAEAGYRYSIWKRSK